jgi:hypothetical protein
MINKHKLTWIEESFTGVMFSTCVTPHCSSFDLFFASSLPPIYMPLRLEDGTDGGRENIRLMFLLILVPFVPLLLMSCSRLMLRYKKSFVVVTRIACSAS